MMNISLNLMGGKSSVTRLVHALGTVKAARSAEPRLVSCLPYVWYFPISPTSFALLPLHLRR